MSFYRLPLSTGGFINYKTLYLDCFMRFAIALFPFLIVLLACQQDPSITEDRDNLQIDNFRPDSGRVGDTFVIHGKGFAKIASDNEVKIGTTNAQPIQSTDSTLTVRILPSSLTGKVSVIVDNKVTVSAKDFRILKDTMSAWQTFKPNIGQIRNIHFLNAAKGFCASDNGLYKSLDSGKTWQSIHIDPYPKSFFSIHFYSDQYGYSIGNGVYSYTMDGGNTWKRSTHSLYGLEMSFVSPSVGFLSERNGIYKTTDFGESWQKIYSTDAHGVYFTDEQNGWITNNGQILKTIDGGKTFIPKFTLAQVILGEIKFTDNKTGWSHGFGTLLFKTVDGGESWSTISTPAVYAVSILNNNLLYEAGKLFIHASRDGGNTWKPHHRISKGEIEEVFFLDEKTGWAADNAGNLYRYCIQ